MLVLFFCCDFTVVQASCQAEKPQKKRVYMSYILHGNMNYDRYVVTTLWRDFPVIYDNLLTFLDEHPDFKGQLQFSGQTLGSLKQAAPHVLDHAMRIHKRGQLNFTGTFYSEPVNVNMDGETNYRCALLGTRIVEDFLGEKTDGFYLQERAYHPQLPWIFNHSDVSWTPVITNDDSWRPFRLIGLDGSSSVCVPITRKKAVERAAAAPENSLITIEEDYEIPQKFGRTYQQVADFNAASEDVEIVWITVKEYIEKFGVAEGRYIDHSAKVKSLSDGTYSRWTADPQDIIIQDYTARAMADFRAADIFNALLDYNYNWAVDKVLSESDVTLLDDPLAWNIERADLYPEVEPKFLARNGEVTMLSRAEHLLLWAVNSDSKGWYPLAEKRSERTTALKNCSIISTSLIHDGMDRLAKNMQLEGYDTYFMALALEHATERKITLNTSRPYAIYDYASGESLPCRCERTAEGYTIEFEAQMPSFGYVVFGAKEIENAEVKQWCDSRKITAQGVTLTASDEVVTVEEGGSKIELSLMPFQLKPLSHIAAGESVNYWRDAKQYGATRIKSCGSEMIVDRQIDWLLHMRQHFAIEQGRVVCNITFTSLHPLLIRRLGEKARSFDPRGLDLKINYGRTCNTVFDIPFGVTEYDKGGDGHFCMLSIAALESDEGGIVVAPCTGEQAFTVSADKGEMTLYLGASTQSGPVKEVVPEFISATNVKQESAWQLEPFFGRYNHTIILDTYNGKWSELGVLGKTQRAAAPIYIREYGSGTSTQSPVSVRASLLECSSEDVDITSAVVDDGVLKVRLNERTGKSRKVKLSTPKGGCECEVKPFGIVLQNL